MKERPSVVEFKDCDIKLPRYRYTRLNMSNLPTGSCTVTPTSSTMCEWRIPSSACMNLARSFVTYQYTVPALAANFACVFEDGFDFRQVYFGNGGGLGIVDLQYADAYVNAIRPIRTRLCDYLTNDQISQFYKCNQLNTSNLLPFSRDGLSAGVQNASTDSYIEPQHLAICPTLNTAYQVNRYVPLSSVVDSVLSLDKDMIFGQDMYLRLWTNYGQRMCYYTTSPNNPSANVTLQTTNMTVSNLYLQLALEENLDIRAGLLSALSSGKMKLTIPYPYTYRTSSPGNSSQASISITLTKNYGRTLKRLAYVPYNAQELSQYAFDHSSPNGTKVQQIQTSIDGKPQTDYLLQCYDPYSTINPNGIWNAAPSTWADDFREAQKFQRGSCLTSYPAFQTQWLYCDQWGIPWLADEDSEIVNPLTDGLDLLNSGDHTYQITAYTPASQQATSNIYTNGLVHYVFCWFVRTLEILPSGIVLSS